MAHILVIDDEKDVRMATVMSLKVGGHSVIEADSGLTAMRLLKDQAKNGVKVDLIVCDVVMQGMSGHEVCQLVRLDPAFDAIPFIFLSARRETDERLEGMDLGADDYLGKPFALQELLIRVNAVLSKHKQFSLVQKQEKRTTADPLIQLTLAQCIELIVHHKLSGKLSVLLKGSIEGDIFFENGHAVHSKLGDQVGEVAVRTILSSELMMYSFEAYEVSDQMTMAMDISRIIKH